MHSSTILHTLTQTDTRMQGIAHKHTHKLYTMDTRIYNMNCIELQYIAEQTKMQSRYVYNTQTFSV